MGHRRPAIPGASPNRGADLGASSHHAYGTRGRRDACRLQGGALGGNDAQAPQGARPGGSGGDTGRSRRELDPAARAGRAPGLTDRPRLRSSAPFRGLCGMNAADSRATCAPTALATKPTMKAATPLCAWLPRSGIKAQGATGNGLWFSRDRGFGATPGLACRCTTNAATAHRQKTCKGAGRRQHGVTRVLQVQWEFGRHVPGARGTVTACFSAKSAGKATGGRSLCGASRRHPGWAYTVTRARRACAPPRCTGTMFQNSNIER